jgi:minor histocompatibility antigen H13
MTKKDAAMFPVYLSGYLFGLYILFKLIDKVILSAMLSGFFSLMGVGFYNLFYNFQKVICLMGVIEDAIEKYFSLEFSTKFVINKNLIFNFVVYVK